ncbi:MAG TPA: putative Ig domain-containing protein [Opitutaceae bacterium]|nr:putative Ig domain-containing protein [Opitutaceae bacterium]
MKPIHVLVLLLVLAGELVFFGTAIARHQAWVYPRWFDQVQYLDEAYRGYERARESGFLAGVRETLANISPQGTLHDFWALLVFSMTGPSREAALAVNLLAFAALQAVTFFTARRISGSSAVAWIGVAFLAALRCGWSGGSGSAVDFRLDWMAACAYGSALGVAAAGDGFRSARSATAFGLAVALVLLTRHLTAVYFVAIYALFLIALLAQPGRRTRIGWLLLSGAVALAIAGPSFWRNRHAIYNYYWIGHIDGPERALRDPHLGPLASVRWLLSDLWSVQLGWAALVLIAGTVVALAVARRFSGRPSVERPGRRDAWIAAGIFFIAPAAVLSMHTLKASQPVSILAPAAAWLGLLACASLARGLGSRGTGIVAAGAVAGGLAIFTAGVRGLGLSAAEERTAEKTNALADYVYDRAEECGLARPRLAVTWILDGLNGPAFRVLGYERHGRWLQIDETLPTGLFETTAAIVMGQLGQSDFVCLVKGGTAEAGPWPFNREMLALLPAIGEWCEANLRRVGELEVEGMPSVLYERRSLGKVGGGRGVNFAALLERLPADSRHLPAPPPAAPLLPPADEVLWSLRADCAYLLQAAYSPVRYRVAGLPAGLTFNERTNRLEGRFPRAGVFPIDVTATNAAGSTAARVTFRVEDAAALGVVRGPATAVVGRPAAIDYEAFDVAGRLNLIDVVDATTGKQLDRLAAGEGERQRWRGRYETTFAQPGRHTLLFRITCFDPAEKIPYTYFDRSCDIDVTP